MRLHFRKNTTHLLLLFSLFFTLFAQEEAPLTGRILNSDGRAVSGAVIRVEDRETTTDANGRFRFPAMTGGIYHLNVQAGGLVYNTQALAAEESELVFTLPNRTALEQNGKITSGVVVLDLDDTDSQADLGGQQANVLPALGSDPLLQLAHLPGVETDGESAWFSSRSAGPGEHLYLLDGMEIQVPVHHRDDNGFISSINGSALSRVTLLQGGPTSEYGDTTGAVMAMETAADGKARTEVTADLITTGLTRNGQFAGGRGSYLVSVRRSFADEMIEELSDEQDAPYFFDSMATLRYRLNDNHRLSANMFYVYNDDNPEKNERVERNKDRYFWLTLDSRLNDRLAVRSMAYRGNLDNHERSPYFSVDLADNDFYNDREYSYTGFKQDWRWQFGERGMLKWGFDYRDHDLSAAYSLLELPNFPDTSDAVYREEEVGFEGDSVGLYLAHRWQINDRFSLEMGTRFDDQSWTDEDQWSPRFHGAWEIDEGSRLTFSATRASQLPNLYEGNPTVQTGLEAVYARHHSLGYQRQIGQTGRFRADAWLKLYDDVPSYFGSHTVKGLQLSYGDQRGRFSYQLSYQYSDPGGQDRWLNQAAPGKGHGGKFYLDYRLSRRWHAALTWRYSPGRVSDPYQLTVVTNPDGTITSTRLSGSEFAQQLAPNHQADFRITRDFNPRGGKGISLFLEITNLYNRENELDLIPSTVYPREGEPFVYNRIDLGRGVGGNLGMRWRF